MWLFPAAQVLHSFEEYLQGYAFHRWLRGASGVAFAREQTLSMHVAFIVAVAIAAWLAIRHEQARWLVVVLGVLVLLNSVSHVLGAFLAPSAMSGVVTSVGVWLPLGAVAIVRGWRHLPRRQFALGAAVGVLLQVLISWLAAVG